MKIRSRLALVAGLTMGAAAAFAFPGNITPASPTIAACAKGALAASQVTLEVVENERVLQAFPLAPQAGCHPNASEVPFPTGTRIVLGDVAIRKGYTAPVLVSFT